MLSRRISCFQSIFCFGAIWSDPVSTLHCTMSIRMMIATMKCYTEKNLYSSVGSSKPTTPLLLVNSVACSMWFKTLYRPGGVLYSVLYALATCPCYLCRCRHALSVTLQASIERHRTLRLVLYSTMMYSHYSVMNRMRTIANTIRRSNTLN